MIKLKIEHRHDDMFPATKFECPTCKKIESFYSISPVACSFCRGRLPDMRALKLVANYKVAWHLAGRSENDRN